MEVLAGARYRQGLLQGRLEAMEPGSRTEAEVGAVTREALDTSGIEGERLNTKQVRESASRRLSIDLERAGDPEQREDGLVAMLLDATARYQEELTEERLLGWRSWLFPQGRNGLRRVRAGAWRTGPVQVVSGPVGRERVHFEGPEPERVPGEMRAFLEWFNSPPGDRRRDPGCDRPPVVLRRAPVRGRQRPHRTGPDRHGPGPLPTEPHAPLQHVSPDTPGEGRVLPRTGERRPGNHGDLRHHHMAQPVRQVPRPGHGRCHGGALD